MKNSGSIFFLQENYRAFKNFEESFRREEQYRRTYPRAYSLTVRKLERSIPSLSRDHIWDSVDILRLDRRKSKRAFLAANLSGKEPRASLCLLNCLETSRDFSHGFQAIPEAGRSAMALLDTEELVLSSLQKYRPQLFIVFGQGRTHIDTFYIAAPERFRKDAHALLDKIPIKGIELGAYTLHEDRPTYPVVRSSPRGVLERAARLGIRSYALVGTRKYMHIGAYLAWTLLCAS